MIKHILCSAIMLTTLLCSAACGNTPSNTHSDTPNYTPPTTDAPTETVGGVAIEWVEPALEALVRQELGKPEGIIYQEELDHIRRIELLGESHLFINGDGGRFAMADNITGEVEKVDLHIDDGQGYLYRDGTYEIGGREYSRGSISSLADFANFRNLIRLIVLKNQLLDLRGLETLEDLFILALWDNDIQDAGALASFKQITFLSLNYNNIEDMSAFSRADHIKDLYLAGNQISSLEWLSGFSSVSRLVLDYNPIVNLDGLEKLWKLEHLQLGYTQVEDISALAGNISLIELNLDNLMSKSFDLAQVTSIPDLEVLNIRQTQAELINFRSLAELKHLKNLFVTPNINVPEEDIEWLREQLPFCDIE